MDNPTPTQKSGTIAVCISGSGRSLQNLLRKNIPVRFVISSTPHCAGIDIARQAGIEPLILDFNSTDIEAQIYTFLDANQVSLVVLAGFLKKFPTKTGWEKRIINIHPALLPKYGGKGMYGISVHRAVRDSGEKVSGATIHYVNQRYDEGGIIAQATTDISDCHSPEQIAAKVFDLECDLLPNTIQQLLTGQLPLPNGQIYEM